MNQLFDFFFTNEKLRWKVYVAAGGASLIYALVNLWVFRRNEERVFSETVWVLVFLVPSIALFAAVYARRGRAVTTEPVYSYQLPRGSLRLIVAGAGAVALLTNMLRIDVATLQASLADFALARIASQFDAVHAASLSPEQLQARFQRIESIVANSSANQIPVDAATLKKTQSTLAGYLERRPLPPQTNQAGWAVAIDLEALALKRDVQTGQIISRQIGEPNAVLNSILLLDHDVHFQGEHSVIFVNDMITIKGAFVTFDKIDFGGSGTPLVLLDDRATALVSDSILQAGAQILDGITWVNVRFEKTRILYNEGPLRLRNVSFKDCDLRDLEPPFHNEQELLKRIREAHGQPFTYVYEPVAAAPATMPRQPTPTPFK
ncbi:MAG: hypothetical protein DMG35_09270 [Acidobacteria bacterium]|nr:MAG: hypothetical protein DMG35_09270 [Acidobacteriota bacterium]